MKASLALAFFLSALPAVLCAKGKSKPASAPPPAKAPPRAGGVESLHLSTGPLASAADLMAHFEEIDKNLGSLSAEYRQSVLIAGSGTSQSISGSLRYLKPNHLRMENFKPERQTVVSDGKEIWIYRAAQNQAIQSDLADWKKADPTMSGLLDFVGNYSDLLKRYQVDFDSAALRVFLSPKTGEKNFVLRLKLDGPALFPVKMELTVGAMSVETSLENLSFNPGLDEKEFSFEPPKGADVFLHFKPPRPADSGDHSP